MIIDIPAAHTVNDGHTVRFFRKRAVFVPDKYLSAGGTRGITEPFKLEARENIRIDAVSELPHGRRIHKIVPGGQDDAPDLERQHLFLHAVVDGVGLTDGDTRHTLAADTAV